MRDAAHAQGGQGTRTFLCISNAPDPLTAIALENIIVECAGCGRSPLSVFSAAPPFTHPPVKGGFMGARDRRVERFTGARVPGISLDQLPRVLSDSRWHALGGDDASPDTFFLQGPSFPDDRLYQASDAVLMLVTMADTAAGWVYSRLRALLARGGDLPVDVVVLDAGHLEEAALFFYGVREEARSLLKKDPDVRFAGFMRVDADCARIAGAMGCSMVECFPGSPFHGQVSRVTQALLRSTEPDRRAGFVNRMTAWAGSAD